MSGCVLNDGGKHRPKWAGRPDAEWIAARGLERPSCERPALMRCECGHDQLSRCQTSSRAKCRPCSESYRRRVRQVAGSGILLAANVTYLLTLTAPSDTGRHRRGKSGLWCLCSPEGGVDLGQWNGTMAQRWNHFMTDVRRSIGGCEYFAAKEVQRRGALHIHAPIRFHRPTLIKLARLRVLAIRHGFGHEVDLQELHDDRAQGYVSKYVSKAVDQRGEVPFVNRSTGEVASERSPARWRTWSASRAWGESMGDVRQAQRRWWSQEATRALSAGGALAAGEPDPAGGPQAPLDINTVSYASGPVIDPVLGRPAQLV